MAEEKALTATEMKDAVARLLQREQERVQREEEQAAFQKEQKAKEENAAMVRMAKSIETIKWSVVSISSVMIFSMIVGVVVLMEVEREVERIKVEVAEIEEEAERMVDKLRNPFQTMGASLGRQLEQSLGFSSEPDE